VSRTDSLGNETSLTDYSKVNTDALNLQKKMDEAGRNNMEVQYHFRMQAGALR
jgi:hypothetical protein